MAVTVTRASIVAFVVVVLRVLARCTGLGAVRHLVSAAALGAVCCDQRSFSSFNAQLGKLQDIPSAP